MAHVLPVTNKVAVRWLLILAPMLFAGACGSKVDLKERAGTRKSAASSEGAYQIEVKRDSSKAVNDAIEPVPSGVPVSASPSASVSTAGSAPGATPSGTAGDVSSSSTGSRFNQNSHAMFNVIGFAEGTNENYHYIFTFKTFTSFADHPRRVICSGGLCSDASGRYQFLSTTWDWARKARSLPNFQAASQDAGAAFLMENRGVKNHGERMDYHAFSRAVYKLNLEWASFPGSPYGQPLKSMDSIWKRYQQSF